MKAGIDVAHWFLDPPENVRSSYALEDSASEFEIQGLELDWVGVCWDANLRINEGAWETYGFKGSIWQRVKSEARIRYLLNSYRVLLTRARQGMVIFVPRGDASDRTRSPDFYDGVAGYLEECGVEILGASV